MDVLEVTKQLEHDEELSKHPPVVQLLDIDVCDHLANNLKQLDQDKDVRDLLPAPEYIDGLIDVLLPLDPKVIPFRQPSLLSSTLDVIYDLLLHSSVVLPRYIQVLV